jgi:hypothetical protein
VRQRGYKTATGKGSLQKTLQIGKLCALCLLPFLLAIWSLDELEDKHSICLFKNLFGVECYGCGITKAIIAATQLDFIRAFNYNKLIVVVMPLLVYLWGKEITKCIKTLSTHHR